MNRWYDRHPKLKKYLDGFRDMELRARTPAVKGVLGLINKTAPGLIDENKAIHFPLDMFRRRWYDKDPVLWLMFNGLRNAEPELLQSVETYLDSLKLKIPGRK